MSGLSEDILLGLAHRNYEQEEENARASIASLLYHSGDSSAVTGLLARERIAMALIVWFRDHDLERFRQHAYLAAKAEWMYCEHNHPRMIARFVEFSPPPYLEREGNTTKHIEYWFLKTALLLRNAPGDWSRVI